MGSELELDLLRAAAMIYEPEAGGADWCPLGVDGHREGGLPFGRLWTLAAADSLA